MQKLFVLFMPISISLLVQCFVMGLIVDPFRSSLCFIWWLQLKIQYLMLSGCFGGTEGSEFEQQQIFLRTIWYGLWTPSLIFETWISFREASSLRHVVCYLNAGEDVIFIANDWHTALLPCYLETMYQSRGIYTNAKVRCLCFTINRLDLEVSLLGKPTLLDKWLQVAFCIHNIAYQGRFAFSDFSLLNLPDELKSSFDFIDGYECMIHMNSSII